MNLTRSFQGAMLKCVKSFAFFEQGYEYYCIYDTGEYFYIWCNHKPLGVNEIKISKKHKENFIRAPI